MSAVDELKALGNKAIAAKDFDEAVYAPQPDPALFARP